MSRASALPFPFERGQQYSFAALKAFETQLAEARRADSKLSNELRVLGTGSPRWIKLRNEELVPVLHFAKHRGIPDTARFMIMPEGCKVDVQIFTPVEIENLQITIADPIWNFPEPKSIHHGGHYHRLEMEILNRDGDTNFGPITRCGNGPELDRRLLSESELVAYQVGLLEALTKKFQKKYEESEYFLLIFAGAFCEGLSLQRFLCTARIALDNALSNMDNAGAFKKVFIFDKCEGYFFEFSR